MSIVLMGSTSGSITLQEPAVAGSTVLELPASSGTVALGNQLGLRNRLINGAMVIDQRNAGASVTPVSGQYLVDRWRAGLTQSSKFSVQQNAGAVTPPAGFTNYLGVTSLSAYSVTGNDNFTIQQIIEGFNVADLNWGTANAQACTLSFWVRSSLTGTFGGSIATTKTATWVMPFSYTISSANTWTFITVAITAPTATGGTNNDNTTGAFVRFGLGSAGTSVGGTSGIWTNAGNYVQPSGTVSVVGTNGATFYITGVQLEVGSQATSFEYRQYGQELALCQRYFSRISGFIGIMANSTTFSPTIQYPVEMRATPTFSLTAVLGITDTVAQDFVQSSTNVAIPVSRANNIAAQLTFANFSGMTSYRTAITRPNDSGIVLVSAEL
jgi:hypothetical protein